MGFHVLVKTSKIQLINVERVIILLALSCTGR